MKNQNQKKSGKRFSTVGLLAVFILGLLILLYPMVSNWWNTRELNAAISNYEQTLNEHRSVDYSPFFTQADSYNQKLLQMDRPLARKNFLPEYGQVLRIPETDVMGYIAIEKIKVELPIYHTTEMSVLASGVGHLQGSSMPVGGPGTHCVLSAHRGLPSSRLFTDLDDMEIGDLFTITVLDRLLTYQVDQIKIVLPEEKQDLAIQADKDYCTLLTCTPYGINTHRLLVRGTRVDNMKILPQIHVPNEAVQVDPMIVAPIVAIPLLLAAMVIESIKASRKKNKGKKARG